MLFRSCGCLLEYPAGAQLVRCGQCEIVNRPPPSRAPPVMRIQCVGCMQHLMCPSGAERVRCAACSTVTEVDGGEPRFAYAACGGCRALLMFEAGSSHVMCSGCGHTTAVPGAGAGAPGGPQGGPGGATGHRDADRAMSKAIPVRATFVRLPGPTPLSLGIHQLS